MDGEKFILIARAADGGPWESTAQPLGADGLKQASRELAVKILMTQDPTLAGVALLKHGQIDEGLEELIRARNRKPTDPGLKLNLCVGFASSRRYDDAIDCYQQMLQMSPDSPEIKERMAQAYYLKGLRDDAIRLYEELDRDGYRTALLGLGEAKDYNGDSRSAVKAYDKFLATESQDRNKALAHVKKGLALAHLGSHHDALDEYREALKYAPGDVLILVHEGLERADATDIDCGIAQIKSVVDENQKSDALPFARVQLGVLLERKGDWQGAIEQYELAAQTQPNYVEAHMKLAKALAHENRGIRALAEYAKAAKLSGLDLERGNSEIFASQWLANELRDLGNYSGAASAYRRAIQLKSDDSAAHCQLSLILTRQGHLSEAIGEYGSALVPAKVQQLNDGGCLSIVDHLLDQSVATPGPGRARAVAELLKVRQGIHSNEKEAVLAKAENAPRPKI